MPPRPDLDNLLLRELSRSWGHLNTLLFHGGMRPPALTLTDNEVKVGEWRPAERTIALSRTLLRQQPWNVVLEVLKHEMAHQYCAEVLRAVDETAHGLAFRRTCERLGIDARARGLPVSDAVEPERARALGKVQRLLALAESDNVHEAEAAMAQAHRLMRKHNIAWTQDSRAGQYRFHQLGLPRGRIPGYERVLAGLLGRHFFVEAIWIWGVDVHTGKPGRALEISGTGENVELATYVHAFLLRTGDRLWALEGARFGGGARAQGRYLSGMMMGFEEKLSQQARRCEQEEGLVWKGDAGLGAYVRQRHPRLHTVRVGAVTADDAWASGHAAGRDIVLNRPVADDGGSRGRLLGTTPGERG